MESCCATENNKNRKKSRRSSREAASGKSSHPPFRVLAVILLAVLTVGGFLYFTNSGRLFSAGVVSPAEAAVTPVAAGEEVTFPESTFVDGKAKFFDYKTSDGKKVRYFLIKSSDGIIRAAFDACDVCYESGKGYFQENDFMVCRNCGRRFQSTKVNIVTGGCNPSALTRTIRDGKVVIPVQALNEGRKFFK